MAFDINLRKTFDSVAKLYDEARPGYPNALYDDLVTLTGIPNNGRILEIGCGPGKATVPLAKRGYAMTCIELGADLAAVAVKNCRAYPKVNVLNIPFEDWPVEHSAYDVAMSAQAFHWIPNQLGFKHTAEALQENGRLALFWNYHPPSPGLLRDSINQVYQERVPQIAKPPEPIEPKKKRVIERIEKSGYYTNVMTREYLWHIEYTTEQYLNLLNTYSDHLNLASDKRQYLFEGIADCIEDSWRVF